MPNVWTHIIYGESLLRAVAGSETLLENEQLAAYFRLGCQGPDFFFYHRFWPWYTNKPLEPLGNALHQQHCGLFLLDMLDQAVTEGASPSVRAYLTGFVTHHLLDRNLHPYIHCRAGYAKWDHQRFEVILDTWMVDKYCTFHTWNTPVWEQLYIGKQLDPVICELLAKQSRKWYPSEAAELTAKEVDNAYRDMMSALKLFFDPYGWKQILTFGKIRPFVYKKRVPDRDYLNEQRRPWRHPAMPDEVHCESVDDLWRMALEEGNTLIALIMQYLQTPTHLLEQAHNQTLRAHIADQLGNQSYDTGKPCNLQLVNTYADPIWSKRDQTHAAP